MKTFDLEEAAAFLRVSKDSMRDMADSGKVPGAKIGPTKGYRWVFTDDSLEAYLREEVERQTQERRRQHQPAPSRSVKMSPGREARRPPKLKEFTQ